MFIADSLGQIRINIYLSFFYGVHPDIGRSYELFEGR